MSSHPESAFTSRSSNIDKLPVAVIGAGPVGLAAVAHLIHRGARPLVFEAGSSVGHSVRLWRHVRMFSPWRFNVDAVARLLLEGHDWMMPNPDALPTGRDLVDLYLEPLASLPTIAPHLHLDTRVLAVGRQGLDKMKTAGRSERPFELQVEGADGARQTFLARAVIDASGTWLTPNPIGAGGILAAGEASAAGAVHHGIPDVLGDDRGRYAGRRVMVVGNGHSAFNSLLDLAVLKEETETNKTKIIWALRGTTSQIRFGGGKSDALPARGALGERLRSLIECGTVEVVAPFAIERLESFTPAEGEREIRVVGRAGDEFLVDEIIAATGSRPDFSFLREVRLAMDPALESVAELAPLIDPNLHSCGTVRPHGERELRQPEAGFYVVGMKSYGRAPTFLLATGYEQTRSVVASLVGDQEAADRVELDLPETGVCGVPETAPVAVAPEPSCCAPSCCGG